jgi:hypothetical protein
MLGVIVAANRRAEFGTNHRVGSPSSWNAWEDLEKAAWAAADPATPADTRLVLGPARGHKGAGCIGTPGSGCFGWPTAR